MSWIRNIFGRRNRGVSVAAMRERPKADTVSDFITTPLRERGQLDITPAHVLWATLQGMSLWDMSSGDGSWGSDQERESNRLAAILDALPRVTQSGSWDATNNHRRWIGSSQSTWDELAASNFDPKIVMKKCEMDFATLLGESA